MPTLPRSVSISKVRERPSSSRTEYYSPCTPTTSLRAKEEESEEQE
jgi:hypothetical protein